MCRQIYEKKRLENAFDIIGTSFTYGAKLKRNPMSDEERRQRIIAEKLEQ